MTRQVEGILEIDSDRGVIYFHASNPEDLSTYQTITILRICNLPKPIPVGFLDIAHMHGASW